MRTIHSEINAILQAAKFGTAIDGSTLYTTMAPCPTCAKAIITAGIRRVVAKKNYHWAEESKKLFKESGVEFEILTSDMETYKEM